MLNFDSDVDVDTNADVKCKKALHVQYQFRSGISFCMCLWNKRQTSWFGDSKSYLSGLPWATHKCVSLFWRIFLGTFWECRKVITHKCPRINVYHESPMCSFTRPNISVLLRVSVVNFQSAHVLGIRYRKS